MDEIGMLIESKQPKFTESDIEALIEAVKPHEEAIKVRARDNVARRKLAQTWDQIKTAFNSNPDISQPRTVEKLRKKWENIVQAAKSDHSKHKQAIKKTGGGGPPPEISSASQQVIEIMGQEFLPFENKFDSDRAQHGDSVIHLDEGNDGPQLTPTKVKNEKFFHPKKRRLTPGLAPTNGAQDEIVTMARIEHEKKVKLLDLQIAYWEKKMESEFAPNAFTIQCVEAEEPQPGTSCPIDGDGPNQIHVLPN